MAIVGRGFRLRCPRCGKGKVFATWNVVVEVCSSCGLDLERRGGDAWFFTYMTTAFLTGILILFMFFYRFSNLLFEQFAVVVGCFGLIALSLPVRKSVGIAIDFLVETRFRM